MVNIEEYDNRIHNKSNKNVGADQDSQKFCISQQGIYTGSTDRISNKSHDAKRSEVDDPGNDLSDSMGYIIKHRFCCTVCVTFECKTGNDRPGQDTDVICSKKRIDRIIYNGKNYIVQYFDDAGRRSQFGIGRHLEMKYGREKE